MTEEMDGQMSFADLGLWCGKMSPEPCPQTTEKTSGASLRKPSALPNQMPMCLDLRNGEMLGASWDMDGLLLGEYTMHSFGESPKDGVESHLSQILQENVPPKYYLSALACKGILRRSTERGKQIPELLRMVLEKQSQSKTDAEKMGGAKESSYNMTEQGQSQPSTTKRSSLKDSGGGQQLVFGIVAKNSNSMMSDNPYSGIYEADTARTVGTSVDPTCNQGGMVALGYEAFQHYGYRESQTLGCLTAEQNQGVRGDTPIMCFSEKGFAEFEEETVSASLRHSGGSIGGGTETLIVTKGANDDF